MPEKEGENSRRDSVLRVAGRYDPDTPHSQQVARLALRIFDETVQIHRLDDSARELLHYASLLHDIGWSGGERKHKRRSYEMIKSASLDGFSEAEREIIASVARYHGSKPPREHHPWNQALSLKDKRIVRYLSAIIRVADALDRSHRAVVEDLHCSVAYESPGARTGGAKPFLNAADRQQAESRLSDHNSPEEERGSDPIRRRRITMKVKTANHPDAEIWAFRRKKPYFEETFRSKLEVATQGAPPPRR